MRKFILITMVLAFVLAGSGVAFGAADAQGDAASQHTLVIDMAADVETMDPAATMDNSTWKVTYPAYERLVAYKGATTELKPELAKSWEVSDDGKVWTFQLDPGHKFADGTPVDAK